MKIASEFGRKRRSERQKLSRQRMKEGKFPGVEKNAIERERVPAASAVERISHERTADVAQVDADLMGSSRVNFAGQQGTGLSGPESVEGGRRFPAIGRDGHPEPISLIPADGGLNIPFHRSGAFDEGQVTLIDLSVPESVDESGLGPDVARHDHQTRSGSVQPVDDAGTDDAVGDSNIGIAPEKSVDEGPPASGPERGGRQGRLACR